MALQHPATSTTDHSSWAEVSVFWELSWRPRLGKGTSLFRMHVLRIVSTCVCTSWDVGVEELARTGVRRVRKRGKPCPESGLGHYRNI